MNNNDCLRLQVSIIFLLVAPVGATAIIRHPGGFVDVPVTSLRRPSQSVARPRSLHD
jgi:hypothetical protein